ncbi:ABC transporter ATP-binding protein [Mobilitalea sibirica]|uniref:ABC transporter ATP-binding protein n=1 Tax=Mobilitalea sibirica TaxID=1462919 RepID=A0A8J7KSJ3_9FIRM|nr:ABC transporter ATP-binding protein [Mobilitalea sibirica]MBH1940356.1 ABC transporter ATP-binding protein [Mobilitalea sibirica]
MALLKVTDLQVYYGVIQAIKGISFEVNAGEVIALIGANGAGKTTILHAITGLVPVKSGSIEFEVPKTGMNDKDIVTETVNLRKTPAHKIVSLGMAHVPEGRRIFSQLTVLENLKMGAYTRNDKEEMEQTLKKVYKRFPRLEERKNQVAGTLSGGEQQMLAMGRALMSHPRIILMDEPSMGLSPILVEEIFDIIKEISKSGTTVLLVEQNAKKALSIANRAYVLETGNIVLEGDAKELMNDESVKKAYLGE